MYGTPLLSSVRPHTDRDRLFASWQMLDKKVGDYTELGGRNS
jgi:hypothetical protein